ncbi:MAG: hypothetical protein SGILL_006801 [Bacillariaceae sp.]
MAAVMVEAPVVMVDTTKTQRIRTGSEGYNIMKHEGEWSNSAVSPSSTATSAQGYKPIQDKGQVVSPTAPSSLPQQRQQPDVTKLHPSPARTASSHGGGGSGDARSVYSSATSMTRRLIVFATPAKYTPVVWVLLAIPLVAVLVSIIMLYPRRADYRSSGTAWGLVWTMLLIMVLYMAVLPRQIDVRSNGTIGIKTALLTFHIDGVVRAYQAGSGREDFLRPRVKFGTSMEGRIILRRNHGKWDVVVSPQDVEGFLNAVEEMKKDFDKGVLNASSSIVVVPKPNLASTDTSDRHAIV